MLTFEIIGPDDVGQFSIIYSTPGSAQQTVHSIGYSAESAQIACAILNELQVEDKRQALRDRANRIVKDL